MNYEQTIEYLYNSLPLFSRVGAPAYKPGLETTKRLDDFCGNPHRTFHSVHVAGTNGKGSTSQMIYAALRAAGHSVGLYTSPHLLDFRERIVVDDAMIERDAVVDFVARIEPFLAENPDLKPSFFELTVAMAFDYCARQGVDYAVVEVGMGGRLDSTNIITPALSVVTNISLDHTQFLGSTIAQIAAEKAGIIKASVPVVVGETQAESASVFEARAAECGSRIIFADRATDVENINYETAMIGDYQKVNARTAAVALRELGVDHAAVARGIGTARVRGRWEVLGRDPLIVADTGHNHAGLEFVVRQIERQPYDTLYFVLGVVADKDISAILGLLPRGAHYIFTAAAIPRALAAEALAREARAAGLRGEVVEGVGAAVARARELATPNDMIFIGGSTFVVAEAL